MRAHEMATSYPRPFKIEMIRRMTGPDAVSATQLAKEVAPCQSVLSSWLREARAAGLETYCRTDPMSDSSSSSSSSFSADDKLRYDRAR